MGTILFDMGGYVDPHVGLNNTSIGNRNGFITNLNDLLGDFYKYIVAAWWIVIGLSILGLVYSIIRYMSSTINSNPRMRDEARQGIFTSLVIIALCGATPFVFSVILTLLKFFGNL